MFSIPNILTLCNLLCGCVGITLVFSGNAMEGALWVWIGALFDFLDGFASRVLNVSSPMGKDLDSLADLVTFGVLPSVVMYSLMAENMEVSTPGFLPFTAFLIAAFSALRLAKFNNDVRQSETFFGLPTPANALFLTALPFVELGWVQNPYTLLIVTIIFSLLLISEVQMFALKFKTWSIADNLWKYLGVAAALALFLIFRTQALPIIIIGYIIISLLIYLTKSSKQ